MSLIKGIVPDDIEKRFRKKAMEKFGYGKGAISKALEEALRRWIEVEGPKDEERVNNAAYEAMREEVEMKHTGKFVAIEEGKIVAVGDSLEKVFDAVQRLATNPSHRIIVKAGEVPPQVVRLGWRLRRAGPTRA